MFTKVKGASVLTQENVYKGCDTWIRFRRVVYGILKRGNSMSLHNNDEKWSINSEKYNWLGMAEALTMYEGRENRKELVSNKGLWVQRNRALSNEQWEPQVHYELVIDAIQFHVSAWSWCPQHQLPYPVPLAFSGIVLISNTNLKKYWKTHKWHWENPKWAPSKMSLKWTSPAQ